MSLVPAPTRPSAEPRRRARRGRSWRPLRAFIVALGLAGLVPGAAHAAPAPFSPSVVGEAPQGQGVFRFPQAVALSAGGTRVYVGDQYSGVVQVFDGSGNWIRNIGARAARDEDGRLGVVGGVAVDKSGHLYVLDAENDRVQIFDGASGQHLRSFGDKSTFDLMSGSASAGAGIVASGISVFQYAPGAAIDVYVADSGNDRIERFTLEPGGLAPIGPPALSPAGLGLQNPQGLTLNADGSKLYVADDGSHRIVMLDPSNFSLLGQAGSLGGPPGSDPTGFFPYDVAVDGGSPAKLYVADNLNGRVQVFDATTLGFLANFGRLAYGPGQGNLEIVRAVHSQAEAGPGVAVADTANNRIQRFDGAGNVTAAWGIAGRSFGYVSRPRAVAFTPNGGIAIADTFDQRIALYDPDGTQVDQRGLISPGVGYAVPGSAPGQFELPSGVAFTGDGSMWVSDATNKRVVRENSDGTVAAITQPGAVDDPRGLTPSPNGVYVASRATGSVVEVMSDGSTSVERSGLMNPIAVAGKVDGSAYYVADDRRIRNITTGTTIPAPEGGLWDHPAGIAFDGSGNLYVSEQRPGTPNGARVMRGVTNDGTTFTWETVATEGDGSGQVIEPAGVAITADGKTLLVADSGNNRVLRFDVVGTSPPVVRRLNVAIDQPGRGTVTSDVPGIACVTDCTQGYGGGRTIKLIAQASTGQQFVGWGGDCTAAGVAAVCSIPMTTDHNVTAKFIATPTTAPPVVRPELASASIKPRTLHPARRASRRLHRAARKATRATVHVRLSKAAKIELGVMQGRPGRREGSSCKPQTRKNRRRAACTRFVQLKGVRAFPSGASIKTTLTPTWRGKSLPVGNYRLAITLIDGDGTRVGPITRAFTVAR